jgi:hypothetical protein
MEGKKEGRTKKMTPSVDGVSLPAVRFCVLLLFHYSDFRLLSPFFLTSDGIKKGEEQNQGNLIVP